MEGEPRARNARSPQKTSRQGRSAFCAAGTEPLAGNYFWFPRATVTLRLALMNVTGVLRPRAREGLSVAFAPGWGASALVLRAPGSDTHTVPEGSALWPCPLRVYPFVSWLQPLGVWPPAKGELQLLALFAQKERMYAEMEKQNKTPKEVGSWLRTWTLRKTWRWGPLHRHKREGWAPPSPSKAGSVKAAFVTGDLVHRGSRLGRWLRLWVRLTDPPRACSRVGAEPGSLEGIGTREPCAWRLLPKVAAG